MKKLILVMVLLVGLTTFAQGKRGEGKNRPNPEEQVEKMVARMTAELNLSDKQQNEVKVFLLEQAKTREAKRMQMKERREKGQKPTDEEIAQLKKERADEELAAKTKMKKILSEEQYKQWSEVKKEMRNEMRGKIKERRAGKAVEEK